MSERRACRITGQHRSTQRHLPRRLLERDDALRGELRALSRAHPRWGYRKAWASLREQGWETNRKKIQRLWREEGLRVPRRKRKRQRLGQLDHGSGTAACPSAEPRVGVGLPVRHHDRRPRAEAAARRRRAHPRSIGDPGRATRSTPTTPSACSIGLSPAGAASPSWCGWTTAPS